MEFDVLRGWWDADDSKGRCGTGSSMDSNMGLAGGEDIAGAVCVFARSMDIVGGAFSCVVRRVRCGLVKREVMLALLIWGQTAVTSKPGFERGGGGKLWGA
jgi:hypothetical protein